MPMVYLGLNFGQTATDASVFKPCETVQSAEPAWFKDRDRCVPTRIFITEEQMSALSAKYRREKTLCYEDFISLGKHSRFTIGEEASYRKQGGVLYTHFKQPVCRWNRLAGKDALSKRYHITYRFVMACFVYEAVCQIMENTPDLKQTERRDMTLTIGYCAHLDWISSHDDYAELAADASGIEQTVAMPEAKAHLYGFLYRDNFSSDSSFHPGLRFSSGVAVIDCGTDSTRVSFFREGEPVMCFDEPIGGQMLDNLIFNETIKSYVNSSEPKEKKADVRKKFYTAYNLADICRQKHFSYCFSDESEEDIVLISEKDGKKDFAFFSIDKDVLDELTKKKPVRYTDSLGQKQCGTLAQHYKRFFEEIRNTLSQQNSSMPDKVILCGGASKMPFVQTACEEVFGAGRLIYDDCEEATLAEGLALAEYAEQSIPNIIDDFCSRLQIKQWEKGLKFEALNRPFCEKCIPKVRAVAMQTVSEWNLSKAHNSVKDLEMLLTNAFLAEAFQKQIQAIYHTKVSLVYHSFYADMLHLRQTMENEPYTCRVQGALFRFFSNSILPEEEAFRKMFDDALPADSFESFLQELPGCLSAKFMDLERQEIYGITEQDLLRDEQRYEALTRQQYTDERDARCKARLSECILNYLETDSDLYKCLHAADAWGWLFVDKHVADAVEKYALSRLSLFAESSL